MHTNLRGASVEVVTDATRDTLLTAFGKATLEDRYLLPGETYQGLFARVASYYSDDSAMAQRMYDYISRHWFMPATPVLSNGGTDRGFSISCFLNAVPDSLDGIRGNFNENIQLAANGGGIGTYWGEVRSIEETIRDRGTTSGVIPFIKIQDSLTLGISQGSLRRGSAAVYLDIHHPEIEEFVDIRRVGGDPNRRCLNIHHGISITDDFMRAVENGDDFNLISPKDGSVRKTIKARDLWIKILNARLETGEPYMLFTDTVNRNRPQIYQTLGLKVRQSNLCSEIALHTGMDYLGKVRTAVCCLGSINAFVMDDWFGNELFLADVARFLDNVLQDFIDKARGVPGFENAVYSASMERSIGIGMMGFHSLLQRKGIPYESALAHGLNRRLFRWLSETGAIINEAAADLYGPCPDAVNAGLNIRWSHMFSIAPTASISIIAGTTSPGVEPMPANVYTQKTLNGSFEVRNAELDKVIRKYAVLADNERSIASNDAVEAFTAAAWKQVLADEGSVKNLAFLDDYERDTFKTFMEIDQRWVINHAAERAKGNYFQMASNNISLPADAHKQDLHNIHMKAWRDGVPSLYYLRSKSLLRGAKVGHTAGEMPQPTPQHDVALVDRGETPAPLNDEAYEVCLACQ